MCDFPHQSSRETPAKSNFSSNFYLKSEDVQLVNQPESNKSDVEMRWIEPYMHWTIHVRSNGTAYWLEINIILWRVDFFSLYCLFTYTIFSRNSFFFLQGMVLKILIAIMMRLMPLISWWKRDGCDHNYYI